MVNNTARSKQKDAHNQIVQNSEIDLEIIRHYRSIMSHLQILKDLNRMMNQRWDRIIELYRYLYDPDELSVSEIRSIAPDNPQMNQLVVAYDAIARRYDKLIEGNSAKVGGLLGALRRRQEMIDQGTYRAAKPLPEVLQAQAEYGFLVKVCETDTELSKRLSMA